MSHRSPAANHESVYFVGTGAMTSVGLTAAATAAAVRAGISGMAAHPILLDKEGEPMVVCASPELSSEQKTLERCLALALPAATEALTPLLDDSKGSPEISLLLSLPEISSVRSADIGKEFAEQLSSALAQKVNIQEVAFHCQGHAGGFNCMQQAIALINSGKSQLCLIGGVDSYLETETLESLDGMDLLHSESTIWGFCPGEAAGFCLISSRQWAYRLGLSTAVELVIAASAEEINPITSDRVCIGQGLSDVFNRTLSHLPEQCKVDRVICDINGEPYRGDEYGFAIARTNGYFADEVDHSTPADCWGDVGSASGPLFVVLAVFEAARRHSLEHWTLLWASSEQGLRGAALLRIVP